MKKVMIMAAMAAITFSACSQKLEASKVPTAVKASFEKKYPGVTAKWEKENGNYEVNFKNGANTMSVLIEPNGSITETEMDIKVSELPATVLTYVKEHYPGKNIKEGAKIIKADGTVNYEAEVGGTDIIFDTNGKFLRETKD